MTAGRFPGLGHVYDLIVVGAGVAGSELAVRCARAGMDVLLVTTSLDTVYTLLGDGVVLAPFDDTLMADLHREVADARGFVANWAFHRRAKYALEHEATLHLLQSSVSALRVAPGDGQGGGPGAVMGVTTWEGVDRLAPRVALCVGSFLEARLSIGALTEVAGRLSEMAYDDLYHDLVRRGFGLEPLRLSAHAGGDDLPYTVACRRFAASEWDAQTFALPRIPGLYAAGVCVSGALPYELAARQGRRLALRLLEQASVL